MDAAAEDPGYAKPGDPPITIPASVVDAEEFLKLATEAAYARKSIKLGMRPGNVIGGEPLLFMTFRPMTGADWRSVPANKDNWNWGTFLDLAVRLTDEFKPLIDKLTTENTSRVVAVVRAFIERGR